MEEGSKDRVGVSDQSEEHDGRGGLLTVTVMGMGTAVVGST